MWRGVATATVDGHSLAAMTDADRTCLPRAARRWHVAVPPGEASTVLVGSGPAGALGDRVRELREAAGLSQRELAERTGTTQSAIARLEADRQEPTLRTLEKLAAALGQDLLVFFPCAGQP